MFSVTIQIARFGDFSDFALFATTFEANSLDSATRQASEYLRDVAKSQGFKDWKDMYTNEAYGYRSFRIKNATERKMIHLNVNDRL